MDCERLLRRMRQYALPGRGTGWHIGIIGFRCLAVIPVLLWWRSRCRRWHWLLYILKRLFLHVNRRRIIVRGIAIAVRMRGIPPRGPDPRRPNKDMGTNPAMDDRATNGRDVRTRNGSGLTANDRRVAACAR